MTILKSILDMLFGKKETISEQKASSEAASPKVNTAASTTSETAPAGASTTASAVAPAATAPAPVAEAPKISASLAEQLHSEIARDSVFLYAFETGTASTTPDGMSCSTKASMNGEPGYIALVNGKPDATSGGKTGGYSILLPYEVEAAASGHHISVRVIARAAGGDHSRFAVAYSTNEVGNSGWRWFDVGAEWAIHTMEYDVNVMKEGRGDFVGILPDSEGNPGTELCYLAISIS